MKKMISLVLALLIVLAAGSSCAANDFGSGSVLVAYYNTYAEKATGAEKLDASKMQTGDGVYFFNQDDGLVIYFDGTDDFHISTFIVRGKDPISLLAPGMTCAQTCIDMSAEEYRELLKYTALEILRANAGNDPFEIPAKGWGGAVVVSDGEYYLIFKEK